MWRVPGELSHPCYSSREWGRVCCGNDGSSSVGGQCSSKLRLRRITPATSDIIAKVGIAKKWLSESLVYLQIRQIPNAYSKSTADIEALRTACIIAEMLPLEKTKPVSKWVMLLGLCYS
jgi:hypothetical protein